MEYPGKDYPWRALTIFHNRITSKQMRNYLDR